MGFKENTIMSFKRMKKDTELLKSNQRNIKKDIKDIKDLLKERKKEPIKELPSFSKPITKTEKLKQRLDESRKNDDNKFRRRGFKKQEVRLDILKVIEKNKDICTSEIQDIIMKKFRIGRTTFYDRLRELKYKGVIEEKIMDGNKGYSIIKEKQSI